MTIAALGILRADTASAAVSPRVARAVVLTAMGVALVAGYLATGSDVTARAAWVAGIDLARLLRAMAGIKALMAAAVAGVVLWRLGSAVNGARLAAYALACGAMAAGPGLVWGLAHVSAGALLLHGGLLASVLILWRDPAMGGRLAALVASRRTRSDKPV